MKTKLQVKSIYGDVLFEYEAEDNSIAKTVQEAVKNRANLSSANLSSANLSYANLRYANLRSADLRSADLSSANLSSANLSYANLRSANLRSANLSSANLSYANLSSANLRSANLRSANLRSANLRSANLRSANLRSADLRSANLRSAKNSELAIAVTRICPEGDIIGWKKCVNGVIVKLLIPKEAKRNNAFGRKCRAEFADVLEIFGADKAYGQQNNEFVYEVGKRVTPDKFDEDFTNECSNGIHFFITRLEAEQY